MNWDITIYTVYSCNDWSICRAWKSFFFYIKETGSSVLKQSEVPAPAPAPLDQGKWLINEELHTQFSEPFQSVGSIPRPAPLRVTGLPNAPPPPYILTHLP